MIVFTYMHTRITDFVPQTCTLLALGEPTHGEPAFARLRNDIFHDLAEHCGFRSIILETDRVKALALNDFVQHGTGYFDDIVTEGFSHGFGDLDANRQLITWLRDHNRDLPESKKISVHGFDAPTEMASAPSPAPYLRHVREYLGHDIGTLNRLAGDETTWSRAEAVLDHTMSPGRSPAASILHGMAGEMRIELDSRAPELIPATSFEAWRIARTHLSTAIGLLDYHRAAAQPVDETSRWQGLNSTRDAIMAQNLFDIRRWEYHRGPSLVFANNQHIQRHQSNWHLGDMDLKWYCAGAIVSSILGGEYTAIVGSLGQSESLKLDAAPTGSYEHQLAAPDGQPFLTSGDVLLERGLQIRGDIVAEQGYFPLDARTIGSSDAILHITVGTSLHQ